MAHFKALVFGFDVVLKHALAECAHGGHGVFKHIVAKVAGAAVERRHLGEQLRGLQALFSSHANRAARGGNQDHVRDRGFDGVHANAEALAALRRSAIVLADMHVNDRSARIIGRLGFADDLLNSVRNVGVLILGDFRAADGGCDNKLIHFAVPP